MRESFGRSAFLLDRRMREMRLGAKAGQKTDGARANCVTSHFMYLFTYWREELTSSVVTLEWLIWGKNTENFPQPDLMLKNVLVFWAKIHLCFLYLDFNYINLDQIQDFEVKFTHLVSQVMTETPPLIT